MINVHTPPNKYIETYTHIRSHYRTIIRYTMSRIVPRYRVHELKGIPNLHKK